MIKLTPLPNNIQIMKNAYSSFVINTYILPYSYAYFLLPGTDISRMCSDLDVRGGPSRRDSTTSVYPFHYRNIYYRWSLHNRFIEFILHDQQLPESAQQKEE